MKPIQQLFVGVVACSGFFAYVDISFGEGWIKTTAPDENWFSVASSSSGTQLVAAAFQSGIYVSVDSGASWRKTDAPEAEWWSVASSADGTTLVAVADTGEIYTSLNSGGTWQQTFASQKDWLSVAASANGEKWVAVNDQGDQLGEDPGSIYLSKDSGLTWRKAGAPDGSWFSVASSASGKRLAASDGETIYTSSDSGMTWKQRTIPIGPEEYLSIVACSRTGRKLAALGDGSGIFVSRNSGATWKRTSAPQRDWRFIASSGDGNRLLATDGNDIYASADSGETWGLTTAPEADWNSIASSRDGTKWVATTSPYDSGGIYVWQPLLPEIVPAPADRVVLAGTNVTFNSGAFGVGPFAYHWKFNGTNLRGASKPKLTLKKVTLSDSGSYSVEARNKFGRTLSADAVLTVLPALITSQPMNQAVLGGTNVTFSINTVALAPLTYQWQFNGTNLSGATSQSFTIDHVSLSDVGSYSVVVGNKFGSVSSEGAWLMIFPLTVLQQPQPASQTAVAGMNISFSLDTLSTVPIVYQWRFNGVDIVGETNSLLTLSNINFSHSGAYSVLVGNDFGNVLSSNALLTVVPALITTQPASGISATGAVLNASVTSGLSDTVVWFEWGADTNYGNATAAANAGENTDPVNIASAINGLTANMTYHYRAIASNSLGLVFGDDKSLRTALAFAKTGAPETNWTSIASSADGVKLAAAGGGVIYLSANSGDTWEASGGTGTLVVSSADGMILFTLNNGQLFSSFDFGESWASNSTPASFSSLAVSADGSKLAAISGRMIYASTNFGVTWLSSGAPSNYVSSFPYGLLLPIFWTSIASSADGNKLAATSYGLDPYGRVTFGAIYTSTDSGQTWARRYSFPFYQIFSIASSADGGVLAAITYSRTLISTNSANNWQAVWTYPQLHSLTLSGDGTTLAGIAPDYYRIFTSPDSGQTLFEATAPFLNWSALATSADGKQIVATANGGGIYISRTAPEPTSSTLPRFAPR